MKLLTIIALAFSFIRPINILAEDVVNTTDTAISPAAVEPGEVEEEQNTILALLLEMYNRPEVQSSLSILALSVVSLLMKMFLTSNKSFLAKTQGIIDTTGDILTIKDEAHQTWELVKKLSSSNDFLREKVSKIEKGEQYLGDLLKGFISATNIKVDDKIELAKKFDEFKAFIEEKGLDNTQAYQEINSTIHEFKEKIEKTNAEELKQVDEYLANLKAISNENQN
jgi:cell division protein ZapA (FtsZ GTPase activity inhibitor)